MINVVRVGLLIIIGMILLNNIVGWFKPQQQRQQPQRQNVQRGYGALQAMLAATGDPERDRMTYQNTVKNQTVSKEECKLVETKPKKSLKFDLNNNVTCEFLRTQVVETLLPEEAEDQKIKRRSILRSDQKQKCIIKTGPLKVRESIPAKVTEDEPLIATVDKKDKQLVDALPEESKV